MLVNQLPTCWAELLGEGQVDWDALEVAITNERAQFRCFPPAGLEFNALRMVEPDAVKVVICGQDPYHGAGQAHGLAFSVAPGVGHPPSLRNLLMEVCTDLKTEWPLARDFDADGVLGQWAREGVLLLNDVLTVREGAPGSHRKLGWETLTSALLNGLAARENQPLAVLLWGNPAQRHAPLFTSKCHRVFQAAHPSPLSAYRGFFGSRPFSQANAWLVQHQCQPVDWIGSQ